MKHCNLCDLPFSQCAHGLAKRNRRSSPVVGPAKRAKSKGELKKPTKERRLTAQEERKLPSVLRGARVVAGASKPEGVKATCSGCGRRPRYGRFARCQTCLRSIGALDCVRCGRTFMPPSETKRRKRTCPTCRSSRSSAYAVGSMGAPTLGNVDSEDLSSGPSTPVGVAPRGLG